MLLALTPFVTGWANKLELWHVPVFCCPSDSQINTWTFLLKLEFSQKARGNIDSGSLGCPVSIKAKAKKKKKDQKYSFNQVKRHSMSRKYRFAFYFIKLVESAFCSWGTGCVDLENASRQPNQINWLINNWKSIFKSCEFSDN